MKESETMKTKLAELLAQAEAISARYVTISCRSNNVVTAVIRRCSDFEAFQP